MDTAPPLRPFVVINTVVWLLLTLVFFRVFRHWHYRIMERPNGDGAHLCTSRVLLASILLSSAVTAMSYAIGYRVSE
jgi:hypothetical protein